MQASYLPLLVDRESGDGLEFVGRREGEELVEGTLRVKGREVGEVVDGVACFCEEGWSAEGLERLWAIEDLWGRNWRGGAAWVEAAVPAREACEALAAVDGVILELAAGPGGGYLSGILHRRPEARVIANDQSRAILRRWREFLAEQGAGQNVCFAAFDARQAPLRDGCVAAVSGVGAFGSIGGSEIFTEAFRVLTPGGPLQTFDHIMDPDDWRRLPEEFRARWEGRDPGMTKGVSWLLEAAGFRIGSRRIAGGRALDADEGGLPHEAAEHGVTLHVMNEHIAARKPA